MEAVDFLLEEVFFVGGGVFFWRKCFFVGGGDVCFWSRVALTGHRNSRPKISVFGEFYPKI